MAEELFSVLMRFHREVVIPDIQRIVGNAVAPFDSRLSALESNVALDSNLVALRNDMLSHFDGMYKRFDRLESEYDALTTAVKRIEDQPESEI